MKALLERTHLFFEFYNPLPFYGHALLLFLLGLLLIFLVARPRYSLPGLLSLPVFLVGAAFFGGILVVLTGLINHFVVGGACLVAVIMTYFFNNRLFCSQEKVGSTNIAWFNAILATVSIFYLLSIDHNFVAAQYDASTYQFIGELLFRNQTYPSVPFAGSHQLTVVPPPGFFILEYAARWFWNDPRSYLLLSWVVMLGLFYAIGVFGVVLFDKKSLLPFLALAAFSRPLIWNFWEFNLLRQLSLVGSILFMTASVLYARATTSGQRNGWLLSAMLFLSGAMLSHPENTAYVLFAPAAYVTIRAWGWLRNPQTRRSFLIYVAGFMIPISAILIWLVTANVFGKLSGAAAVGVKVPVQDLRNLLFHFGGILPPLLWIIATFWMCRKPESKPFGLFWGFCFVFLLGASYYSLGLHFLFPGKFPLERVPFDQFSGVIAFVRTILLHPHGMLLKLTSYWWLAILATAWVLERAWSSLSRPILKYGLLAGAAGILFLDVIYLYYNRPIISPSEFAALKEIKPLLTNSSVIVAPPGYAFSAWTGPVLEKDSVSFRGFQHTVTTLSEDLPGEVEKAYQNGDFNFFKAALPNSEVVVLFNAPWREMGNKMAGKATVVFENDSVLALKL